MDDLKSLISHYMTNFKRANFNGQLDKYVPPGTTLHEDPNTPYQGYNGGWDLSKVYMNPNKQRDQINALDTYFHENAHADQGYLMRIFRGKLGTPGGIVDDVEFPYYGSGHDLDPNVMEKLATMRAGEAMTNRNESFWNTVMGEDVLNQVKQQDSQHRGHYTEAQLKSQLDAAMHPRTYVKKRDSWNR